MKTLYQSLKPEYRKTLQSNENKFPSAVSSVRKSLENNFLWSRLTVQEVRDFMTFSDNRLFELSYEDWAFGTKFLQDE
tara:strand:- start:82 stop:315 length:234 start_codon:yes stop_codon:yes gene_type:complete